MSTLRRTSPASALDRFSTWLRREGARFERVAFVEEPPHPRGVVATSAFSAGETVLSVPRHCVIDLALARSSSIGREIARATAAAGVEPHSTQSYLAAFLLEQRLAGPSSFFAGYIDVLPTAFPSVPLYFAEADLAELRGSLIVDLIEARRQALSDEDALLREHVPAFRAWSEAEFVWARCVVTSRIFGVALEDGETECLVPLADMLNHRRPRQTNWGYARNERAFVITAIDDLSAGAEVHDSYGAKCNSRFLLNYGYTLDDNDANECRLRLRMARTPALEAKRRLLGLERGAIGHDVQLSARYDEAARKVFSFLRVAFAEPGELQSVAGGGQKLSDVPALSRANEGRVLVALAAACDESLARFDTSLSDDEALLAGGDGGPPPGSNRRNCIVMRSGEKRILHHYRDLARAALQMLSEEPAALIHRAARAAQRATDAETDVTWRRFEGYLRGALLPCVTADRGPGAAAPSPSRASSPTAPPAPPPSSAAPARR